MKTYIQLKDGIGFAVVNTTGETEGIEVDFGTGEQYLKKVHNKGKWENAPIIWYAEVGYDGSIIELKKTYFPSEVGDNPIITPDVPMTAKWVNNKWNFTNPVEPVVIIPYEQGEITGTIVTSVEETKANETTGDTI